MRAGHTRRLLVGVQLRRVLVQEPYEVVRLPAIADEEELHRVETVFGRQSLRRRAGEALHPEREPPEMLEQIRSTLGE